VLTTSPVYVGWPVWWDDFREWRQTIEAHSGRDPSRPGTQ
jgi:hypothetical protein